ncbi:MAG: hypothetical protein GWP66_07585 [Gammaproteobacteria bacterium]|jgi:hypothetical protein|nr:hypothetical protein [Gammaproteobacteria bacterium]
MAPETAYLVVGGGILVAGMVWAVCLRLFHLQHGWPRVEHGQWRLPGLEPAQAVSRALYLVAGNARARRRGEHGLTVVLGGCIARLDFTRRTDGAELNVELDWARGARMFGFLMGLLVLVVQPAIILGIGGALWHWSASDPTDEGRRMAWQVVQVAHVLWPPFLVHAIHHHLRRQARGVIDQLVLELGGPVRGFGRGPS